MANSDVHGDQEKPNSRTLWQEPEWSQLYYHQARIYLLLPAYVADWILPGNLRVKCKDPDANPDVDEIELNKSTQLHWNDLQQFSSFFNEKCVSNNICLVNSSMCRNLAQSGGNFDTGVKQKFSGPCSVNWTISSNKFRIQIFYKMLIKTFFSEKNCFTEKGCRIMDIWLYLIKI